MPYYSNSTKLPVAGGGGDPIENVLGSFLTRAMCIVEATERRRVPNVPAINMVLIWVSTWLRMGLHMAQDGATGIVSGGEVLAVLAVLIMNVLGPSLTRAT